MPDNTYPPFASDVGGSINPRQLNRWIDVSPQGGSLKRTQGYIELPVFNQAVDWKGYSEIVAAYNFTGQNNFVLTDVSALPVNPNYVLCIAYKLAGVVYRYKLAGDGGVFYFTLTDYNKQAIKHNFRLEVWSVEDANVSQASTVKLFTSVHSSFDYRNSDDFELVNDSGIVTDFSMATDTVCAAILVANAGAYDGVYATSDSGKNYILAIDTSGSVHKLGFNAGTGRIELSVNGVVDFYVTADNAAWIAFKADPSSVTWLNFGSGTPSATTTVGYAGWSLPLTFPSDAAVPNNT